MMNFMAFISTGPQNVIREMAMELTLKQIANGMFQSFAQTYDFTLPMLKILIDEHIESLNTQN